MNVPVINQWLYRQCLYGHMPAEALNGTDRTRLFRVLYRRGWTDVEIATHTRWSTYTTVRIRESLCLVQNVRRGRVA